MIGGYSGKIPARSQRISEMAASGMPKEEIARQVGASIDAVQHVLRRFRRNGDGKPLVIISDDERVQVIQMRRKMATARQISDALGLHFQAVCRLIRDAENCGEIKKLRRNKDTSAPEPRDGATVTMRPCLGCRQVFKSLGNGNRRCQKCKDNAEREYSPYAI